MTNQEYINEHPEQFKDEIDKFLFNEFNIIGGCCSAQGSFQYSVGRQVAEKLMQKLGWKPASEIPPIDEKTGRSETVIAVCEGPMGVDMIAYTSYHKEKCSWFPQRVKYWIFPPTKNETV